MVVDEMIWRTGISVLIFLSVFSLLTAVLIAPPAFAQVENVFTVSPGEFTARNAPPMGEPYTLPQNLVVWNRDNIPRSIFVTSEVPPENFIRPGYDPLPNENWVIPYPSSVLIEENDYALIQISMNIPRDNTLTGQRWEVWIPVERQPILGEVAVLRPTVRMKIETTGELPAVGEGTNYLVPMVVGLAIAIVVAGVWVWSRRKGRKKPKRGTFSRSRR